MTRRLARAISDLAGLDRLAQAVEHLRLEFRQLVEEQHAVMGEGDFAGARTQAAADERRHGGGMMRGAEGAAIGERAVGRVARDRVHHRDFEQLARRERRQDGGQPLGQHRLAGAGRSVHQQIVAAGGGDLQRPLGALLALDVLRSGSAATRLGDGGLGARQHLRALEMIGELDQRARRDDGDIAARPGGLRPAGGRTDQPMAAGIGGNGGGQHAGDRRDRAVERQLAEHREAVERVRRDGADGRHDAERDGQIVVRAFLGQVGGRQIDGDALARQRQARGDQRGAHALARFGHRLVGEADDVEDDIAVGDLHLHVDGARLDALERHRRRPA